jgi:lysophospholipase L1-like esterase
LEARAGDGVHPNAGGYDTLANIIADWPAWRELISLTRG